MDPSFPLFHSISNVICAVVFGYHFSDEDKTFHELIHATEKMFKFAGSFVHQVSKSYPVFVFFFLKEAENKSADTKIGVH